MEVLGQVDDGMMGAGRGRGRGGRGRGRPVDRRTIRGPPAAMRTIIVNLGGRWYDEHPFGLHFRTGYTRYVHNVEPDSFKFVQLLQAVMRMFDNGRPPTRFWYHRHGVAYPDGLMKLHSDEQMEAMWANVENHGERVAVVYAQDKDVETDAETDAVLYELPARVPSIVPPFNTVDMYASAYANQLEAELVGPANLWKQEAGGRDWYVSQEAVPRVYGV